MRQPISFGKYLLLERINVGGMAEIFLARSRGVHGFKRILAIKKILPTMAEDEEFIAMFVDEARIAAELSHAGIVQIFELGKFEDDYYIAMEFVHGKDMRFIQERLARERRPISVSLASWIILKICEALDYAHSKKDPSGRPLGIIHRDVSPQNVIISYEGEVKICDFGIAKAANRSQKTQAGVLKGKFGYMSPEQVRGLPLDGRSDIFTVGTLFYEMVTLERLFVGESDFSTLEKVRNADVVPPSTYNRDVPEELEEIILRALSKEVEDRFQSTAEFGEAVQTFMLNSGMSSARELSGFMKDKFQVELEAELRRLDEYQELPEEALRVPGDAVRSGPGPAESNDVDLDAKTLIFASSEVGADKPKKLAPPPIPKSRRSSPAANPLSAASAPAELLDAKTMIFQDPDIQPEDDISELPTKGVMDRPDLRVIETGGPARTAGARTRSLKEKLFFPMAVFVALLLGWSLFVTTRLQQRQPVAASPELELITWPSTDVKVFLNNTQVASDTPFIARDMTPGVHSLRVEREGYEQVEKRFELSMGTRMVMELSLKQIKEPVSPGTPEMPPDKPGGDNPPETIPEEKPTVLIVDSDPPGATVYLDGKKIGKTPLRKTDLEPKGKVKVHITHRGYKSGSKTLKIKSGEEHEVRLVLAKASAVRKPPPENKKARYGYLVANTRPWSKVYVDGKYTGRETPIPPDRKLKLTAGKHKVIFETPGGKRYAFEIEVEPEKVLKLIKRLE
jgi:serine/threonine protein kinase